MAKPGNTKTNHHHTEDTLSTGRLVIFTAPSGAGKTTIVRHLMKTIPNLAFSVSATSRGKRDHEKDGVDYYFLSVPAFQQLIRDDAFLEWEEVYQDQFYGTLKSEVNRLLDEGKHVIFDIDVEGALRIKKMYQNLALAIFVKPPSREILFERLQNRKTESEESLKKRIEKATRELTYETKFDVVLLNDDLETTLQTAEDMVHSFLHHPADVVPNPPDAKPKKNKT